jgi:hypothetical protein
MKTIRRYALALATVATVGTVAVLGLSATPFGAIVLRNATHNVVLNARAGGIGGQGAMNLTISPSASVLARVNLVVHVTYTCDQMYDPFTGMPVPASQTSGSLFVSAQQRSGSRVANGNGGANVQPACDAIPGFFSGTQNQADIVVSASGAPFKNGSGVAQVSGNVCENGGFTSFGQPACDSGQSNPTVIAIK